MENAKIFQRIYEEPSWFFRWGTWVITLFFCILITLSFFFSYNEVTSGKIIITSDNPSVYVQANHTGRLLDFQLDIEDSVLKDEVLAVIENPASKKDIDFLKKQLLSNKTVLSTMGELGSQFPLSLSLGSSIQPFYTDFLRVYQQIIMDGALRDDKVLKRQLLGQQDAHNISVQTKEKELKLFQKSMQIVLENYNRNEILFQKGIISKRDFETVEKELNDEQTKMNVIMNEYKVLLTQEGDYINKENQLTNIYIRNKNTLDMELLMAHQELLNSINDWENKFVLKSPITGKVSFVDEWGKISRVSSGEIVFTISPLQKQKLVGKAVVPGGNAGKLRIGQKAIIRLDNYPPREWGTVNVTVKNFAQIPGRSDDFLSVVYFEIPDLTTSYGKTLEFKQDLSGKVEIILDEFSLIQRIFYQFRNLWYNSKT